MAADRLHERPHRRRPGHAYIARLARGLDSDRLAGVLTRVLGDGVTVAAARRVTGGASLETWLFDAIDAEGRPHGLVLRRDPGSHTDAALRTTEYRLLAAAHAAGVAVPEVV